MQLSMRAEAQEIINYSIDKVLPDHAVKTALFGRSFSPGKLILIAIGKAAWQMAYSADQELGERVDSGVVITKYGHARGPIRNYLIMEAGHPIVDQNSFGATKIALDVVSNLTQEDTVLFLVSGGGSALFELPMISEEELVSISRSLLACGAGIEEINTIRKRLSFVKAGRFGLICAPAKVLTIVLSDIIGDPLDMIASGPAYPDFSTYEDSVRIFKKYEIPASLSVNEALKKETPSALPNVETIVTGSVRELCHAVADKCEQLGYEPIILTDSLNCEAREAGRIMSAIARYHQTTMHPIAFIAGGETVVRLTGSGKGGRNQELALSAADGIAGLKDTCIFSFGSDGTDGPTDAAGGYCDGETKSVLCAKGTAIQQSLADNDAYNALERCDGLIRTGPTGTNVNDATVLLIKR